MVRLIRLRTDGNILESCRTGNLAKLIDGNSSRCSIERDVLRRSNRSSTSSSEFQRMPIWLIILDLGLHTLHTSLNANH